MAIVQCVPNFSEGRDLDKIEKIVEPLRGKEGVKLVNYEADKNYNRLVVTVIGEPTKVKNAILEAIGVATDLIDMNKHKGQHSRFGATDVCPFIPIKDMTMDDAINLARELGKDNIRVNAVAPGVIRTDMVAALPEEMVKMVCAQIPLGRMGEPEDIANAFAFLASDSASFITGACIPHEPSHPHGLSILEEDYPLVVATRILLRNIRRLRLQVQSA